MDSTYSGTGSRPGGAVRPAVWNAERRRRLAEAIVDWHRAHGGMTDGRGVAHYMMNVGHECIRPLYMRYLAANVQRSVDGQTGYRTAGDIGLGPYAAPGDVDRIEFELCLLRADVLAEMEKQFVTAGQ